MDLENVTKSQEKIVEPPENFEKKKKKMAKKGTKKIKTKKKPEVLGSSKDETTPVVSLKPNLLLNKNKIGK